MLSDHHKQFLKSQTLSIWIGTASADHMADAARSSGVIVEDADTLHCFVPQKFAALVVANVAENKNLAFIASEILNFTTYQYKCEVLELRASTDNEMLYQRKYMNAFATAMSQIMPLSPEALYNMYYAEPTYTLKLKVLKAYEQTPRQGTGGLIAL